MLQEEMTIRLDTMSFTFDGQTALFDYAYDLAGRQTQSALTLNNVADRTINIEYDYLGRALSSELTGNALNDILAEFDYNAVGALTNVNRYEWDDNDDLYELIAKSNIQYNARNQITSIAHNNAAGNSIVSHGYLYDADGNISQYTNSLDGSVLYDYDFLGQLTGANYSNLDITDESYQYDLNGNRELVTNANGDLVVYSTGLNNELNSDGNYSYAYDAEGNRISKTNAAGTERELYTWDYRNRLSSVTKQTYDSVSETWQTVQIVEYAYDYNNVLIRKVLDANGDGTADSKTLFLPENYQTAIQLDDADLSDSTYETVSHRYLWTPGQQDKLLADIQVSPTGSETLWTLTDHLGTIRDIVKYTPSGLVVPAHIIYDAYGNVLSCKDANGTDVSSPVLFGFTGKYFDADTQLQNNVNRWYDATVGRWLSTDPIGFNGNDTNLYRYVGNRTVFITDYLGLDNVYPGGLSIDDIGKMGVEDMKKYIKQLRGKENFRDLIQSIYQSLKGQAKQNWKKAEKFARVRWSSKLKIIPWFTVPLLWNSMAEIAYAPDIERDWRDPRYYNVSNDCKECICTLYSTPVIVPSWWTIGKEVEYFETTRIDLPDSYGRTSAKDCALSEFEFLIESESVFGYTIYEIISYKCTWGGEACFIPK